MKILSFLALSMAVFCGSSSTFAMTDLKVEQELTVIAKELSNKFPMAMGGATVMGAIAGPGRRITYLVV